MKLLSCSFVIASVAALAACTSTSASDGVQSGNAADTAAAACTPDTQGTVVANAMAAPIQPPRFAAGLDLAGDANWSGVKLPTFETALCAGTFRGAATADDPTDYFGWGGDGAPLYVGFDHTSGLANFIQFFKGYTGSVDFKSRDGAHTFSAKIGEPVMKDGQPVALDFAGNPGPAGTEIVDALVATFAPSLTPVGDDCRATQRCLLRTLPGVGDDDNTTIGVLGSRDVHFYIVMPGTGDQPGASAATYFYMFPEKEGMPPLPPPTN
jgi:hypothetical protein